MRILAKGFNFSQDGPGNRLVLHLQGCNFRCPWCSNPESMEAGTPGNAEMTPEEVVRLAVRSKPMFFEGGGVTFTGGEATLQYEELMKCLQALRAAGINTALETNGSHPELVALSHEIDHLIIDLKIADDMTHRRIIGASNAQTKKNIQALTKCANAILVRIPLINHVNTDPEPFAAFFDTCDKQYLTVELLPYHEYGRDKWTKPYTVTDGFVTPAQIQAFSEVLLAHGISMTST